MDPSGRFALLVDEFSSLDGVVPPGATAGFGSSALRFEGRIFAMLAHDRLVVKLPAARVTALVDDGEGERYDAGKGRPMKEWLSLLPDSTVPWSDIAHEAFRFARR
jgi:TfoX/Sxy family transcriptional regulator of competence genes